MHQEWRRNRFQALYQAMKRRKMLMRLQKRRPVPREVSEGLWKGVRDRERERERDFRRVVSGETSQVASTRERLFR
eukprot:1326269-Amorphochlora_amoeboformis.AAC.1